MSKKFRLPHRICCCIANAYGARHLVKPSARPLGEKPSRGPPKPIDLLPPYSLRFARVLRREKNFEAAAKAAKDGPQTFAQTCNRARAD